MEPNPLLEGGSFKLPVNQFGEHEIALIVLDVEGVITPSDRGALNLLGLGLIQDYCRRVNSSYENNIIPKLPPIVLCTGRASGYVESKIQTIGAIGAGFVLPSVIENGACFWDPNLKRIVGYHPAISSKEWGMVREAIEGIKPDEIPFVKEPGKEICISLNPLHGLRVDTLYERVREVLAAENLLKYAAVTHSTTAVDITPRGVGKRSGLEILCDAYDVPNDKILGVGDSKGDIEWLNYVGVPAAPLNATPELRKGVKLRAVAPFKDAMGTAVLLQQFVLQHVNAEEYV